MSRGWQVPREIALPILSPGIVPDLASSGGKRDSSARLLFQNEHFKAWSRNDNLNEPGQMTPRPNRAT
jgi:hypothetical protein